MQVEPTHLISQSTDTRKHSNKAQLPYKSPTLQYYGDIRDVTLGGSPGGTDSLGGLHVGPGISDGWSDSREDRKRGV